MLLASRTLAVRFSRRGGKGLASSTGPAPPRNASDCQNDSRAMPADLSPLLEPPDPSDADHENHLALISGLIKLFELDQETARVTDDG